MATITIPATYSNGIIKPKKSINIKPKKIFITIEYEEEDNKTSLLDYIKSDEYKNEDRIYYDNVDNFLKDLKLGK